jgi:hypothetical protein
MSNRTEVPLWLLMLVCAACAALGYWIVSAVWTMPWASG